MRNFGKCKCGAIEAFGSDPPPPCDPCEKCGTIPGGREPIPHDFYTDRVDTDDGDGKLTRCRRCMKTMARIERERAQDEKGEATT